MRICVYAFSTSALFFRGFIQQCATLGDDVEWSAVFPQGHFRHELDDLIPKLRQCYLYENYARAYNCYDDISLQKALENGDIIGALLKDKDGFCRLDSDEQLRRGATIFNIYHEFLTKINPEIVLCPDVEVVDGFILINVCKKLGIPVVYYAGMRFLGGAFFSDGPYQRLPAYFGEYNESDLEIANDIIEKFQSGFSCARGVNHPVLVPQRPSWFRRIVVSTYLRLRYERLHATEETLGMRIKRNMMPVVNRFRRAKLELKQSHLFDISSDKQPLPDKFILYFMQMTPESSINGLAPYYVDQLRVIDLLLMNMPKGHVLLGIL